MNEVIKLDGIEEFETYSPLLILNEDVYLDNQFCILITDMGNVAFSYYELGVAPSVVIQNKILFLSFGTSYYVIDLIQNKLLYQSNNSSTVIYTILKYDLKPCIIFIGELSLLCFSMDGVLSWKNDYRYTIYDWKIVESGIFIIFENGKKMLVSVENGNGVLIT